MTRHYEGEKGEGTKHLPLKHSYKKPHHFPTSFSLVMIYLLDHQ
jgi:hypothetical protein